MSENDPKKMAADCKMSFAAKKIADILNPKPLKSAMKKPAPQKEQPKNEGKDAAAKAPVAKPAQEKSKPAAKVEEKSKNLVKRSPNEDKKSSGPKKIKMVKKDSVGSQKSSKVGSKPSKHSKNGNKQN